MEEYKLVSIEDNIFYFTHVIKDNTYNFEIAQQVFESLETFGLTTDKDRFMVVFEISILQKFINVLVLKYQDNDISVETTGKNKINEYDGLLRKFLMRGTCQLTISFNLVDAIANKGKVNLNMAQGNLTGERSFVRKYRLKTDNIILGSVVDKTKKVKEPTIKFSNS